MIRTMAKPKVGEILVRSGLIDEMQLRAALGDQRTWGHPLGMTLVKMGVIEERDLVRALAQQLQLPIIELEGKRVQPEVLELVPADFAEKHLCVPLFVREKGGVDTLHVGMEDPCNVQVIDDLSFRTGMQVQPVMVSPSELCEAIDRFYHRGEAGSGELVSEPGPSAHPPGVDARVEVHESLFPEVSANPEDSGTLELCEEAPVREASPAAAGDATNRTILRALCYLLIEKGVISKDELQGLVARLSEDGD
jgi:type IV pilus assembly protein PilB